MGRRLSLGETSLGVAIFFLAGFVASQVVASQKSGRATPALSPRDSIQIAELYRNQLGARHSTYRAPEWLAGLHIAQLQAKAALDVSVDKSSGADGDSIRSILASTHGSYLEAMLREDGNTVARWSTGDDPIRVWVQPHSVEAGFTSALVAPVRRAFLAWNEFGLDVSFAVVDDSSAAVVHVTWSATMPSPEQIGTTFRVTNGDDWIQLAHVVLSTSRDIHTVQNAARHEAGHVLGLGHSPHSRDIMAATTQGRQWELTEADRRTAALLYRLPAGAITILPAGTTSPSRR